MSKPLLLLELFRQHVMLDLCGWSQGLLVHAVDHQGGCMLWGSVASPHIVAGAWRATGCHRG